MSNQKDQVGYTAPRFYSNPNPLSLLNPLPYKRIQPGCRISYLIQPQYLLPLLEYDAT